ncbi:major facilitator superfamily domain-containing protein [Armillaria mellea]|nr:major facilitator superfamily domain-containing protein [Armillaria mellea]
MSVHDKHDVDSEKHEGDSAPSVVLQVQEDIADIDLATFHELRAGRLVIDPAEAKFEFGETFASKLKLSRDGTKVLWPQPTDSPRDPQNWTDTRKSIHLFIVTLASIIPDFDQRHSWSIFLLGWGGIFAVLLIRRYGRLPVLFWSQVFALGFLVGCTFAPNLATFAGMRCLTAFFGTAPQVAGLYIVTDLYPFHLQARKLNFWTMGFIVSPFLSPFAFGFLVARQSWRWAYGIGCIYSAVVCILIALFLDETMYDRTVKPIPEPTTSGLRYRIETLLGVTGIKMAKYRVSWTESILSPINVVWRPHLLGILVFEGILFGFGIGINVTNAVFLGSPASCWVLVRFVSSPQLSSQVSVLLGELIAESRLWACYIALPLYICGFVTLGASIQNHLNTAGIVMGWGISELSIMINTVAIYAYCNDCFPKHQGEISALINLARVLGGFAVAYFQVPWAEKHGALQTFGCEAAIVAGLFVLIIPAMQIYGRNLRERFSVA